MKAIDTNILARFFIDDADDVQASQQRPIAIRILSQAVYVPITVILEFEWVMRGFYKLIISPYQPRR
jgi:predicted nucleic-acid-binding protein